MSRTRRQHRAVIEAITGLSGDRFSGWEIKRRTGIPRMTVTHVLARLAQMGLVSYGPRGSHQPWVCRGEAWLGGPERVCEEYEKFAC